MTCILSVDGLWHCTMRYGGRIYMGYGPTRGEAKQHCWKTIWDRAGGVLNA